MKRGPSCAIVIALLSSTGQAMAAGVERASLPAAPPPAPELLERPARSSATKRLHPRVILRGTHDQPVLVSAEPINTRATCGTCHDVDWIAAHGRHFSPDTGASMLVPMLAGNERSSPNCFFCHVRHASTSAVASTLAAGEPAWAATAALLDVRLIHREHDAVTGPPFAYVTDAFAPDGSVSADQLQLGPPPDGSCGACHGLVIERSPELADWLRHPQMTELTGQVFAPRRISDSTLNLKDKDRSSRTWDVHAERLVHCSDCHFSPNDPRARPLVQQAVGTLKFEPRHASLAAFLGRPDHDLSQGIRCTSCHEAHRAHDFLPHSERHLSRVACEACHIPKSVGPALQELNFALPVAPSEPGRVYRGIRGGIHDPDAYVEGFEPVLVETGVGAGARLSPVNLVTTWTWRSPTPAGPIVPQVLVDRALFDGQGHFRTELVSALDRSDNQALEPDELVLDTADRLARVKDLLQASGIATPHLVGEVRAHPLHHGVVTGRFALRECSACHGDETRLRRGQALAADLPPGATLYAADAARLWIEFSETSGARRASALPNTHGFYVFGASQNRFIDATGMSIGLLTLLGALSHAGLRMRAQRRQGRGRQ